jgi:hypothetical protein
LEQPQPQPHPQPKQRQPEFEQCTWNFADACAEMHVDGRLYQTKDTWPLQAQRGKQSPVLARFAVGAKHVVARVRSVWWGLVETPCTKTAEPVVRLPKGVKRVSRQPNRTATTPRCALQGDSAPPPTPPQPPIPFPCMCGQLARTLL